jgi:hypothetical protein
MRVPQAFSTVLRFCLRSIRAGVGGIRGFAMVFAALVSLGMPAIAEDLAKSGTVEIEQVQIAFLYSGNLGGGRLYFKGKSHPFSVGGLGIGGIGISKMQAVGQVYNLKDVRDFPGAYGQARYGFAAGDTSGGKLWLQNTMGVVIELAAKREGLALSLGADAVYFSFK